MGVWAVWRAGEERHRPEPSMTGTAGAWITFIQGDVVGPQGGTRGQGAVMAHGVPHRSVAVLHPREGDVRVPAALFGGHPQCLTRAVDGLRDAGQASALRRVDPRVRRTDPQDPRRGQRSEEHTSELQSPCNLVCRLLLEKKKNRNSTIK